MCVTHICCLYPSSSKCLFSCYWIWDCGMGCYILIQRPYAHAYCQRNVFKSTSERFLCLRYAEESKRTRVFILFQVRRCLSHTPSGISSSSRPLKLLSGCLKTHRTPMRKIQSWSTKKASIRTAMEPQAPGVTTSWDLTSLLPWWWYVERGSSVFSLRKPTFISFFECFFMLFSWPNVNKVGCVTCCCVNRPQSCLPQRGHGQLSQWQRRNYWDHWEWRLLTLSKVSLPSSHCL